MNVDDVSGATSAGMPRGNQHVSLVSFGAEYDGISDHDLTAGSALMNDLSVGNLIGRWFAWFVGQHQMRSLPGCHPFDHPAVCCRTVEETDAPVVVDIDAVAQDDRHHIHCRRRYVQGLVVPKASDVRALRTNTTIEADHSTRQLIVNQTSR